MTDNKIENDSVKEQYQDIFFTTFDLEEIRAFGISYGVDQKEFEDKDDMNVNSKLKVLLKNEFLVPQNWYYESEWRGDFSHEVTPEYESCIHGLYFLANYAWLISKLAEDGNHEETFRYNTEETIDDLLNIINHGIEERVEKRPLFRKLVKVGDLVLPADAYINYMYRYNYNPNKVGKVSPEEMSIIRDVVLRRITGNSYMTSGLDY